MGDLQLRAALTEHLDWLGRIFDPKNMKDRGITKSEGEHVLAQVAKLRAMLDGGVVGSAGDRIRAVVGGEGPSLGDKIVRFFDRVSSAGTPKEIARQETRVEGVAFEPSTGVISAKVVMTLHDFAAYVRDRYMFEAWEGEPPGTYLQNDDPRLHEKVTRHLEQVAPSFREVLVEIEHRTTDDKVWKEWMLRPPRVCLTFTISVPT